MKKFLSIVLVLVLSFSCFSMVSFAETNTTGHLTEVPEGYVGVYTVEDLYCVRNDLTANYILMNDIDLTEATAKGGDWDFYGNGWNPIGSNDVYGSSEFKGIFDGNGYAVKGMRIEINKIPSGASYLYLGLFSKVSGTVKNLTVEGRIYASVGRNYNLYAGGIAAYNGGTIDNCINKVEISASGQSFENGEIYCLYAGGITGYNKGTISNSINIKDIYGYFNDASDGNSTSTYDRLYVAGISGYIYSGGKIQNCINTGNITAVIMSKVYGYASGIGSDGGTISNCYNTGEIEASPSSDSDGRTAGIGYGATCSYSYNIGAVNGYYKYAISNISATKCYYLTGVGSDSTGATSLTQAQMKLKSMYQGWDFDTVWTMDGRADYPYPELRDVALVLPEDLLHQHEYTPEITTQPTHLAEGVTTYTCECGDKYEEAIAKTTEHTYTPEITTPATHLTEGVTTYTCECGDKYEEPIAKTTEHTYTSEVTKEPTHKEEGVKTFTCECGDTYTETVAKIPHNYNEVVTAPTCTEKGYTTYTCECGDSYVNDYVNEKGHSYSSVVTKPATHLIEGVKTYTCECTHSYTEAIAKTKDHSFVASDVVAPTCEDKGYTVYVCECGDSYKDNYTSSTGHNYDGQTCTKCGEKCPCNCHKTGFMGFIWKITRFFNKLFKTNKTCACGVVHY